MSASSCSLKGSRLSRIVPEKSCASAVHQHRTIGQQIRKAKLGAMQVACEVANCYSPWGRMVKRDLSVDKLILEMSRPSMTMDPSS
jgi:hypothetical protein